jgi:hypothetical protein
VELTGVHGYKRKRKVLDLRFDDEPELQIKAKVVSVGKFMDVMELVDAMANGRLTKERIAELAEWFSERITEWNLIDDDDQPVPITAAYLIDEDVDWTVKVFKKWVDGILKALNLPLDLGGLITMVAQQATGATAPPGAADGTRETEDSIPMQPATPG